MAQPIMAAGCDFQQVFCSPAKRAQQTIELISNALRKENFNVQWYTDDSLYTFNSEDLLHWFQRLDDAIEEIVVIAHNPAITDLGNTLCGESISNVPTCGYLHIASEITHWRQLGADTATLIEYLSPKTV